jgi:hypothetical protein
MQVYATCAPIFFRIFLSYRVWRQNPRFVVLGRPESLSSDPWIFPSTLPCTVIDLALEVHVFVFSLIFPVTTLSFPIIYYVFPSYPNLAWRRT